MKFAFVLAAIAFSFGVANAGDTGNANKAETALTKQVEGARFVSCVNGQALYVDSDKYMFVDKSSNLCRVKS